MPVGQIYTKLIPTISDEGDKLYIQNGLPLKKTLRHTAVVEASKHNAEES
jgi:hypothetical protein